MRDIRVLSVRPPSTLSLADRALVCPPCLWSRWPRAGCGAARCLLKPASSLLFVCCAVSSQVRLYAETQPGYDPDPLEGGFSVTGVHSLHRNAITVLLRAIAIWLKCQRAVWPRAVAL